VSRISWGFGLALACFPGAPPAAFGESPERVGPVFIAEGWFTMGASPEDLEYARRLCVSERMLEALRVRACAGEDLFSEEGPARRVYLEAYWLDRQEVSRVEYEDCVARGACSAPALPTTHPGLSHPSHPIVGINQAQAAEFCRQRGGRLPTEAEWERGARGDSARRFPWGMFHNEDLANHGGAIPAAEPGDGDPSSRDGYPFAAPVDAFASARSPHGLVQMAGNVWEWTEDTYAPLASQTQRVGPVETRTRGLRAVRGGSYRAPAYALRVTHREPRPEAAGFVDVGVRCAYDALARYDVNTDRP
jgi:sulfatase modifying factor 1